MSASSVAAIVLTYNEERHIERCLESVRSCTSHAYVVDSYSEDRTCELAESCGATVVQHEFINQAKQFNWALDNLGISAEWILRIDADEYLTDGLQRELSERVHSISEGVAGVHLRRRIKFLGKSIRHGGIYPQKVLRLFRNGRGRCEDKWMDEHITVEGDTTEFDHDLVDENLQPLGWWVDKHNRYATREAVEVLDERYDILPGSNSETDELEGDILGDQDQRKRQLKQLYEEVPPFLRPVLYFLFRYFVQQGFRDGIPGLVWHFLQGGWYRFLVDAKVYEAESRGGNRAGAIRDFLEEEYGLELQS